MDDSGVVYQMCISNDGVFDTEPWESYATSKSWTVTEGDGLKIVYARFRDQLGNESETAIDAIALGSQTSIAQAKARPTGETVILAGEVVTARFADAIYIEDTGRNAGIRIMPAPSDTDPGELIDVSGLLNTQNGEKILSLFTWKMQPGSGTVLPLGLNNSSLGGSDWLYNPSNREGQRGILGASGLNNIGLLVRTWGAFNYVDKTTVTLDDGSGVSIKCVVPNGVVLTRIGHTLA